MLKETVYLAVKHNAELKDYVSAIVFVSPKHAEEILGENYTLYPVEFARVDGELMMVPQVGVREAEVDDENLPIGEYIYQISYKEEV